jgi:predicted NAD-dependent protein-ADP-ribosyltransferase YbiA (DUF1768 family)
MTNTDTIPDFARHDIRLIGGFFGPYRWLSNFWICPQGVEFDRNIYQSVENAYHAAKVQPDCRADFIDVQPTTAKMMWKRYPLVDRNKHDWFARQNSVMAGLVFSKFLRDNELRKLLVGTDGRNLEEINNWGDRHWGTDHKTREGKNTLGVILMACRKFWKSVDDGKTEHPLDDFFTEKA